MGRMKIAVAILTALAGGYFLLAADTARAGSEPEPPPQEGVGPVDDGTAIGPARGRIKWPEFHYDGGEWELEGPVQLPPAVDLKWGFYLGGRIAILSMPLSRRLAPMTKARGLEPFDDHLFVVGPRLMISLDDSFRTGILFDTGLQSREERVDGERLKAEVNITRLGMILEAQEPLSSFMETESMPESVMGIKLPLRLASIGVGMGLEMGLGNINLSMRGDDLDRQRTYNEPFFFFTPLALISVPTSDWSRLEFHFGYSFVTMNDFSLPTYMQDKQMMKGTDFSGFIWGLQLSFGSGAIANFWPW